MATSTRDTSAEVGLVFRQADSREELAECWPVLRELRPQLETLEVLLDYVARQIPCGYRILAARLNGEVVGVAGWRVQENLIFGRHVYVDDLIVSERLRGRTVGAGLLTWLRAQCGELGVGVLVLDTAETNHAAHRFYEREGLQHGARGYRIRIAQAATHP